MSRRASHWLMDADGGEFATSTCCDDRLVHPPWTPRRLLREDLEPQSFLSLRPLKRGKTEAERHHKEDGLVRECTPLLRSGPRSTQSQLEQARLLLHTC